MNRSIFVLKEVNIKEKVPEEMQVHYFWVIFQKMFHLIIEKKLDYMDAHDVSVDYNSADVDDILIILHNILISIFQILILNNIYIN